MSDQKDLGIFGIFKVVTCPICQGLGCFNCDWKGVVYVNKKK